MKNLNPWWVKLHNMYFIFKRCLFLSLNGARLKVLFGFCFEAYEIESMKWLFGTYYLSNLFGHIHSHRSWYFVIGLQSEPDLILAMNFLSENSAHFVKKGILAFWFTYL
jgi:hypothetical protein